MALKRSQLVATVNDLKSQIDHWNATDDPALMVRFKIGVAKAISQAIVTTATALFALSNTLDCDEDCYGLLIAIDDLEDAFREWEQGCQISPQNTSPNGTPDIWRAWGEVLKALVIRPKTVPTPIGQMVAQGCQPLLIAKTYGWYTSENEPDVRKVEEEIARPGTHYDPEHYEHRNDARRRRELLDNWKIRAENFTKKQKDRAPAVKREAPESLDFLIESDVPIDQIVKMKPSMTREEIAARMAELGYAVNGEVIVIPADPRIRANEAEAKAKADANKRQQQAAINTYPEITDQDERIRKLIADGHRTADVVELLKTAIPGITHQRVTALRKREAVASS